MEANVLNLDNLFSAQISYRIPQFQRPYAWKLDTQWAPLWEDVRQVAENHLNSEASEQDRPHFMGAIVLQQQPNSVGEVTKRLVIDGQQRLTTLQLLLRATQHAFQSQDDMARANRIKELTVNKETHLGGDPDNETKIRQSNQNDKDAFQEAIRELYFVSTSQRLITQGYNFYRDTVSKWLEEDPVALQDRADALEHTLISLLQIAAIELDQHEKPHIIFETLNARGGPLTQSDLVKNTVMYEANVTDDREKADRLWGTFETDFWRSGSGEGRIDRIHLDRFLNYWMVTKTYKQIVHDRVASEFRNYVSKENSSPDGASIDDIAADIRKSGLMYRKIETDALPGIEIFLRRIKIMEQGTIIPILLWLYTSDVPDSQIQKSVEVLESYLVRRMLCGGSSNYLNQTAIAALARMSEEGPESAGDALDRFLSSRSVSNSTWPSDYLVHQSLIADPMRGSVPRRKMVLEAIEIHLRGTMGESLSLDDRLTLEHVMPQRWQSNWPVLAPPAQKSDIEDERDRRVKFIGNLTLTTDKLNTKLSNAPWVEKQKELRKHSTLKLNQSILDNSPKNWNEESIEARSKQLAKIVTKIWRAPSSA